jgi:hypothetical protein
VVIFKSIGVFVFVFGTKQLSGDIIKILNTVFLVMNSKQAIRMGPII